MKDDTDKKINGREVIFQLFIHVLVFVFYAFDRRNLTIEDHEVAFFLSYAGATALISYFLLPRFFYKKKYIAFIIGTCIILGIVMILEEFVIEAIYFPNDRGQHFPGIAYTLAGILPTMTILLSFKFAWDALWKQKEVDDLKALVQESELQFLKSQINPHFLFNNLNNLYAYAIEQSPKTPEIILELSSVLRYMLYDCKSEFVPLTKELQHLKNFTKLSELQIENRGEVRFRQEGNVDHYRIAPLILIVFIENAFKHSQASQSDKIVIDIFVEIGKNGVLHFKCRNSFLEHNDHDHVAHGIGLENVKKRLELIYPAQFQLAIKEELPYFEVDLKIQLEAQQ
jgi:hypothetical protein